MREVTRGKRLKDILEIRHQTVEYLADLVVEQRKRCRLDEKDFPHDAELVARQLQSIINVDSSQSRLVLCFELAAATDEQPVFYHCGPSFGETTEPENFRLLTLLQEKGLTPLKKPAS